MWALHVRRGGDRATAVGQDRRRGRSTDVRTWGPGWRPTPRTPNEASRPARTPNTPSTLPPRGKGGFGSVAGWTCGAPL
eukprot:scaffold237_cov421-Prasinococcus_capsulatus_cf.AAC.27